MIQKALLQNSIQSKNGGIPPLFKGIIAVVVVGGAAFLGYKIYKLIKSGAETKDQKAVGDAATKDLKEEIKKGETLSKPTSAYKSAANYIKNQLDGCDTVFNQTNVVNQIISVVKKPADWFYLVKTFDTKKIDNCGFLTGDTDYDLPTLLKDQLDTNATQIKVDNFLYRPDKDGRKTFYQVLQMYLKKIGVTL